MSRKNGVKIFDIIDTKQDDKIVFTGTPEEISAKLGIDFRYVYTLANSDKILLRRYKVIDTGKMHEPKTAIFSVVDVTDEDKEVFRGTTIEIKDKYKIAASYVYRLYNEQRLLRKRYKIIKL